MTVQTLELKNSLQLRLTQKMQQAIGLLQMSNQELSEFLVSYVESNPLLETQEDQVDGENEQSQNEDYSDAFSESFSDDFNYEDYENVWQNDLLPLNTPNVATNASAYSPLSTIAQEKSFKHSIHSQIRLILGSSEEKEIAYVLTDLLSEDGYLLPSWKEEVISLGFEMTCVETVLGKLQTLEPTGLFARSLEECLLLQLKEKGCFLPPLKNFIHTLQQHNGSPNDLARKLNISEETCRGYLDLLKTLNPKPGLSLSSSVVHQVIPDVLMRRRNPYEWSIELNTANLPKVYLNSAYSIELQSCMKTGSDRAFLQEKLTEAKWLLKSLHQRAVNILKVTDAIVRKQAEFFKSTSGRIKPLTLKEVAVETNLSESTVSRVTTDKYIETPRGLFELKHFFSTNVNAEENNNLHSAKSIQSAIRKVIQGEDPLYPLSDNDIVEHLKLLGICIARRTVAKYRDILKIENASERSRYYKWSQKDGKVLAIRLYK